MREIVCIVCPNGCRLTVDDEGKITGNLCPRGPQYAISEMTNPTRVVTSTVRIENTYARRCPVKTSVAIPKEKIFEAVKLLEGVKLTAPVKIGDVIIENVLDTGADFIVTKNMEEFA